MTWPKVKLGEVSDVAWGNTSITKSQYVAEGYPAFSATGQDGFLGWAENEGAGVVLSAIGARCGKCFFADGSWTAIKNTITIKPKQLTDARFLFQFLNDEKGWTIHGAGQPFITLAAAKRRIIPLPPLAEQKRLAAILDRADELRRVRRESLARLDELGQSLFLELFGDPATNPKGWDVVRLGEIGNLDRGQSKHRPRNAAFLYGGPYPFVQTGDVANCGGYIRHFTQTYSEEGLKQSKLWPAGTLCITIAANIAKTGLLTFEACFPDSIVGFQPTNCEIEYIRAWFGFMQSHLEAMAPESAQKNINLKILRDLQIPHPPLALQQQFAAQIEELEAIKTRARASLTELDALFASLQSRAFAGELSAQSA